ncbi:hypothetical protein W02_40550 [Nitrospira sp. KM1]|nr:hypothetical protein W02_40550 [Nitrospira sp. KM1]
MHRPMGRNRITGNGFPFRAFQSISFQTTRCFRSLYQSIQWEGWIEKGSRLFGADNGESLEVQKPNLHEQRGLIPVDVFVRNLSVLELHHDNHGQLDPLAGWPNAGQHKG